MSTNIIHKRTAVAGRSPTTSQLQFGEIAVNTVDGAIYFKINDGSDRIIEATKDRFVFDVVNNGSGAYTYSGVGLSSADNPTLYLTRGVTYEFHLNVTGHPFYIKTAANTGTNDQYTSGVSGQGTETGIVTFTVPMDAPSVLYYICQFHSSMVGTIHVIDQGLEYTDFTVTTATASGDGALTFDSATGEFTFTPADVPTSTSELSEGTNLYYTDARADARIGLASIDDLADVDTSTTAPTTGQVLKWDGAKWAPGDDATEGGAGLDADTLDGQDGSYYLNYNNFTNTPTIPSVLTDLSITDGTNGQVLTTDGAGNFSFTTVTSGGGIALTDLSVTTAAASGGGSLSYDNTTGVFTFAPAVQVTSIDDLSDVDTTTAAPTNGQALVWDGTNFVPGTVTSSVTSIDDLDDVDITTTTPTTGQVLKWDGSKFIPGNDIQGTGGGGTSGGGGFESRVYVYSISANTTSVTGADDNGDTLSFDGDSVEVYVNGVRLVGQTVDYTASSGNTINFTETVFNGSIVEVVVLEKINTDEVSLTDQLPGTVYSFDATKYRSVKLIIQMTHSTNGYHATEVLLIHDGTTAYMTEYATVFTTASLGVVDASISGGLVNVTVAATTANTDVKAKVLTIEV